MERTEKWGGQAKGLVPQHLAGTMGAPPKVCPDVWGGQGPRPRTMVMGARGAAWGLWVAWQFRECGGRGERQCPRWGFALRRRSPTTSAPWQTPQDLRRGAEGLEGYP